MPCWSRSYPIKFLLAQVGEGLGDLDLASDELVLVLQGLNHPLEAGAPVLLVKCRGDELGCHGDVPHRLLLALLQLLAQLVATHGADSRMTQVRSLELPEI